MLLKKGKKLLLQQHHYFASYRMQNTQPFLQKGLLGF